MNEALLVSNVLLWIAVVVLAAVVVALTRQIGVLHERVFPVGALVMPGGPRVGEAAPAHEPGSGPFDPEDACGTKPHPHDGDDEAPGASGEERDPGLGKPAWAGGPDRRTAEPGHAARDQASAGR